MLFACCSSDNETQAETLQTTSGMTINITIGGVTQTVTLADNAATQALVEKLQNGPVTLSLNTNGDFEIWGTLGFSLPTSNEYINGQPGDVVLYSGSNICIFYGYNSYSYTRLGRIEGLTASELKTFLKGGQSNIAVTLSLPSATTAVHHIDKTFNEDVYYTLSGQKVEQPFQGFFIIRRCHYIIFQFCVDYTCLMINHFSVLLQQINQFVDAC